jgi:hypothetical protein
VLDIQAGDEVKAELASGLDGRLAQTLAATGRFSRVLASSDLRAVLSIDQARQVLGCEAADCFASLAGALDVASVCVARLGRTAERLVLDLKIVRMKDGHALARLRREYLFERSLVADFDASVSALAHAAFGELRPLSDSLEVDRRAASFRRTMRWSSLSGAGVAAALVVGANLMMGAAQQTFAEDTDKSAADLEMLFAAQDQARSVYIGGSVLAVASAALWGFFR